MTSGIPHHLLLNEPQLHPFKGISSDPGHRIRADVENRWVGDMNQVNVFPKSPPQAHCQTEEPPTGATQRAAPSRLAAAGHLSLRQTREADVPVSPSESLLSFFFFV